MLAQMIVQEIQDFINQFTAQYGFSPDRGWLHPAEYSVVIASMFGTNSNTKVFMLFGIPFDADKRLNSGFVLLSGMNTASISHSHLHRGLYQLNCTLSPPPPQPCGPVIPVAYDYGLDRNIAYFNKTPMPPSCECGSAAVKSPIHSSWCPIK